MPPAARTVSPALRALLEGLVDYAGLFPPAALPFDEAVANHLAYRRHEHAWMLARFVVPLVRAGEVAEAARAASVEAPVALSVLATQRDETSLDEALAADFDRLAALHRDHGDVVHADALELKLPDEALRDGEDAVARITAAAAEAGVPAIECFGEVPLTDDALETLPDFIAAVAAYDATRAPGAGRFGLKIRLGGGTPQAHPPVAPVARALAVFAAHGVPFKATAGLHHPIRHDNADAGAPMHGFLNLFAAAALRRARVLSDDDLPAVLADEDPTAFRFSDAALAWRGREAHLDDVREARARFALSIGSCSFEEPVADLRALGLL